MNANRVTRPLHSDRTVVTVVVPPSFADELDRLAVAFASRTGEALEDVRRGVELSVLRRGIEALKREWEVQ